MRAALLAAAILLAPAASQALTFDFTTKPGDTLSADQASAFAAAAAAWSTALADNVMVSLQIGFSSTLGANVLGSTLPSQGFAPYDGVRSRLIADASTAADASAVASLPASIGGADVVLTTAQAKSLGYTITAGGLDGVIEFSSMFSFATSRDSNGAIASDTIDLIGVAEHEIGHLLGFISNLDSHLATSSGGGAIEGRSVLDLFRFAAPGARSYANGDAAYVSIDGGTTSLASFAEGASYQASHWAPNTLVQGVPALLDPGVGYGQVINITPLDALALDAVGWDASRAMSLAAVPEPGSLLLMATAVSIAARRPRRRNPGKSSVA